MSLIASAFNRFFTFNIPTRCVNNRTGAGKAREMKAYDKPSSRSTKKVLRYSNY